MGNEDETVWVTFNGEIYNFQELRPELERCGHRFATHSDTEVIVHAYEQYGRIACGTSAVCSLSPSGMAHGEPCSWLATG